MVVVNSYVLMNLQDFTVAADKAIGRQIITSLSYFYQLKYLTLLN